MKKSESISANVSESIVNMVNYLRAYVKGVQVQRKKGMIETQSDPVKIMCMDEVENKPAENFLKAIRVKNGVLEIAFSSDSKERFTPEMFKKDSNWKPVSVWNNTDSIEASTVLMLEPSVMNIVGCITKI